MTGETGTGKERLARAIHVSGAAGRALLTVRCGRTGAARFHALTDAEDVPTTLFLDGVEDLDAAAQAALIALLDMRPALRAIAATRTELPAHVRDGRLRSDLFFRIAGATLPLPPLRLRRDFDWLLDRLLRQRGADARRLAPAARAEPNAREWPGNIRELEAALDMALARMPSDGIVDCTDLPAPVLAAPACASQRHDLEAVLEACEWNMALAARRRGVNRSTVLRRMRRQGLSRGG